MDSADHPKYCRQDDFKLIGDGAFRLPWRSSKRFTKRIFSILLVTAFIFLLTTGADAQFFVDVAGDDTGLGTVDQPWRTLQYAANQVGPGDRVTVRAGNYTGFHLTTSGTTESPIEFFAEPGVLIDAENATTPDGINLEGASYVAIDGFHVSGMERAGVRAVGRASDFAEFVTIRNIYAANNGVWGIFTGFVDDLLIEANRTTGSRDEHGIYVSNSGDRPVIRRNEVWGNKSSGIHMNGDASLGGDGIISGALVSRNVIFDNGYAGSAINMDGVINSRVENNLIYDNHNSGISLFLGDGGAPSTGNVVVNNTVHQASDGRWALNIQNGSSQNTARNNILISEHPFRGAIDISTNSLSGFESDHNVVISRITIDDLATTLSLADWQRSTGNDLHSLVGDADALFVDWRAGDYQLLHNSVARDSGNAVDAALVDLAGARRPIGADYDIGALELQRLVADLNWDGLVEGLDLGIALGNWNKNVGPSEGELDGTPPVDGLDLGILLGAWQAPTPVTLVQCLRRSGVRQFVPEPASWLLLLLGSLSSRRHR